MRKESEKAMNGKVDLVKMAMLSTIRYPWEHGVCMQAVYESDDTTTAIAMAHDSVLRQKKDGRLSVICDNIAVTDPAANGEVVYWLKEKYLTFAQKVYNTMDNYVDDYGIIHQVCGCPDFDRVGTSAESMAAYLMMHAWR